eukprot:TRINITY_DN1853_c1_g4_i1.p1 TRINITY_DN1853_c1_g4~~TRINITY_DN1853_c1_g4_i1.p1  ORF type:complete len:378 (-),score=22.79 TRINITY_DN1853_c1_g4_i1:86-1219(-)
MPMFTSLLIVCCVIHGGARRALEVPMGDWPQESRDALAASAGADPEVPVPMVPRLKAIMGRADQEGSSRSFKLKLQGYVQLMNAPNTTRPNHSSRVRALYAACRGVPLILVRSMRSFVADVIDGQYDQLAHELQANLSGHGAKMILRHPWTAARALLSEARFAAMLETMQASLRKEFKMCTGRSSGASLLAVSDVEDSTGSTELPDILMDVLRLEGDVADNSTTPSMLLEVNSSTQLFGPKKHAQRFQHKVGSVFPDSWLYMIVSRKWLMLIICTAIDVVGMASYVDLFAPGVGRIISWCWQPVSFLLLEELFGSRRLTLFNLIEELIPFLDLIPSAGLAWYGTYCEGRPGAAIRRIFLLPDRTNSRNIHLGGRSRR